MADKWVQRWRKKKKRSENERKWLRQEKYWMAVCVLRKFNLSELSPEVPQINITSTIKQGETIITAGCGTI